MSPQPTSRSPASRAPRRATRLPAAPAARSKGRLRGRRWWWYVAVALAGPLILIVGVLTYSWISLSKIIEERMHGEQTRELPRIYARPLELHRGQGLTDRQLIDRLNDLSYTERTRVERAGDFAIGRNAVALMIRGGELDGRVVRVVFGPANAKPNSPAVSTIKSIELTGKESVRSVMLEPPLLTALPEGREKRRKVPLAQIPTRVREAVLSIEDRRFYDHPGVDPIGTLGALWRNLRGTKQYMGGGSTITQQLTRNLLLTPEKTLRRKVLEQFMSFIVEHKLSKDEILELYLNEVYLGQRGSFAIHGFAEASRLYFGKDVSNLRLSEAATLAGMIQAPPTYSPFRFPDRARDRRNVVLKTMVESGYVSAEAAERAAAEPMTPVARALESEAPYFTDYVEQMLASGSIDLRRNAADVYTTLDIHLQRVAQDALRSGLTKVDEILAKRKRKVGPAQAALVAVDPRTGEILAMVGGRSYNQSQYNRAVVSRRQPGSVFKPFVYLAAFERALDERRTDITPATIVQDEPTTFFYEDKEYQPSNYDNEYDGPITMRRALAKSRNIATIRVAEMTGYDRVAELWKAVGAGTPARPYPSIALGVFEATPLEVATAYTMFANLGEVQPLRSIFRLRVNGRDVEPPAPAGKVHRAARAETTFLVTNMMRSVMNEGTGAGARSAGFALDAAGKSGTTNDYRDAWFVGFTPELLTVVWVGLDDNRPLGLSGTTAALPIWTAFMTRALAGRPNVSFTAPEAVSFAEIDPETGFLAGPSCPRSFNEAFLPNTAPVDICPVHGGFGQPIAGVPHVPTP